MKKIILKNFLAAVTFMLLKPPEVNAQTCPIGLMNNNNIVALTNATLYNNWTPGTYWMTFVYDQEPCAVVGGADIFIDKSTNLTGVLGLPGSGGMGIYFNPASLFICGGNLPDDNGIRVGGVSIYITAGQGGPEVLTIDFTNNSVDQCFFPPLPVVWGTPFNTSLQTSPLRVVLSWQTVTEANVNHFTVEKSYDGSNWHKAAQVAAVGNSNSPQNYSYTDYNVADRNYYRIVSVDFDCKRNYSPYTRLEQCPGDPATNACPASYGIPNIPADCPAPNTNPHITGPAAICDNAAKLYRLNYMYGDATVTWNLSPANLATLIPVSRIVRVAPTGNIGIGTLTATVVKNGVTTYYNHTITFGIPPLSGMCSNILNVCDANINFHASVNMLPGTNPGDYHWYQDGYAYLGTGATHEWQNIWPGQVIYFDVYYFGPCGQSIWSSSSLTCDMGFKPAPVRIKERFRIAPNPARSTITIMKPPPCPIGPLEPGLTKTSSATVSTSETAIIKIFDTQGKLRKTTRMSGSGTSLTVNANDLPAGLYFVHIIEEGKETVTLKVLLEK